MGDELIGSYRIIRRLGEGGMGVVFEASNDQIRRRVAIKMLHEDLAQEPETAARFLNEARAANLIRHPGIVSVFEFNHTAAGVPYLVLEFLEGEDLYRRLVRCGRLPADVPRLGRQIASALAAAHAKGIVHRDLKPENVMLVHDPEVPGGERTKLLDFGIAKLSAELRSRGVSHLRTRTGATMGTPLYMSPEQCGGAGGVTDRADVYSLGVMFYEMLTGRTPFEGDGPGSLIGMHQFVEPPALRGLDPGISAEIAGLVHAMLRKDPTQRPSMAEVAQQLERLGAPRAAGPVVQPFVEQTVRPPAPRRPRPRQRLWKDVALGVLLACVLGVGAGVWLQRRAQPPAAPPPARALAPPDAGPPRLTAPAAEPGRLAPPAAAPPEEAVVGAPVPRKEIRRAPKRPASPQDYEAKGVE